MGETHEAPRDHNLADFEPHLGYAVGGQAVGGVPLPNTLGSLSIAPITTLTFCGGRTASRHGENGKI